MEPESESRGGTDDDGGGVAGVVVAYSTGVVDGIAFAWGDPDGVARVGVHHDVVGSKGGEVMGLEVTAFGERGTADA